MVRFGVRVGVVIVDTMSAAFSMRDENSAAEMNGVCKAVTELGDAVGAATLVVAHYGKDASTGIRGSSASRAAGESIIAVLADRDEIKGEVKNRRLVRVKSRDGVEGETTRFELENVHLGFDDKGREFGAAKVVLREGEVEPAGKRLGRGERVYLDALAVMMDRATRERPFGYDGPEVSAIDRDIIRVEFYAAWPADGDTAAQKTEAKRKAFNRAEKALLDRRKIDTYEIGGRQMIWLLDDTPDATASKNSVGHAEQPDEQGD